MKNEEQLNEATKCFEIGESSAKRGALIEAAKQHREGLRIRTSLLGAEHLDTLASIHSLGAVLSRSGPKDAVEAEELLRKAYTGFSKVKGPTSSNALASAGSLGSMLRGAERYKDALPLYEEVVKNCKQVLGEKSPKLHQFMASLGGVYEHLGRDEEAESTLRAALSGRGMLLV